MKVKEYFYNIKCDCCGRLASDEWWADEETAKKTASESFFIEMTDGRIYCPECRYVDDNDNYATKDGHIYTGITHELLQ